MRVENYYGCNELPCEPKNKQQSGEQEDRSASASGDGSACIYAQFESMARRKK